MGAEHRLARATLEEAHRTFIDEVDRLSIEEALDAAGGFRSILGVMKHVAGWRRVPLIRLRRDAAALGCHRLAARAS
jgi:hypothetical protein